MSKNQSMINSSLADHVKIDVAAQYDRHKKKVSSLYGSFEELKDDGVIIGNLLQKVKNANLIDNHISTLMNLVKENNNIKRTTNSEEDIQRIVEYYQRVEFTCLEGLKTIFEIREFFTNQKFVMYLEEKGRIFEFSIDDIDKYANSIIPTYTDSLDKLIGNMITQTNAIAPELRKLGLSLKNLNEDNEIKGIAKYKEFVSQYFSNKEENIKENRQLEAALYLYSRKPNADFDKDKRALSQFLSQYSAKGGLSDNIAMYKFGDIIQKIGNTFVNVEVKMHNGTISLNMIANGVKRLHVAFSQETVEKQREKIIKLFTVNNQRLSSVIEKEAQKDTIKNINNIFAALK